MLAEILVKQGLEMSDEGIAEIPVLIGPIIDESIRQVFKISGHKFLADLVDGVVYTVWGCKTSNKKAYSQREISQVVVPLMEEIRGIFEVANLNSAQQFALDYLIRGFIMSRVLRMTAEFWMDIDERDWQRQNLRASLGLN
ncbi:MAG: hypothetical protein ABFD98_10210 [Syntrophobacteraceae bacterium]|nr:hypothetical protein [Desulfobacteraceae bacterium]